MFVLEQQPDPLHALLGGLASAATGHQFQQQKEQQRQKSIESVLGSLNEESSPLDWFRAVNTQKGLGPEDRQELLKVPEMINRSKMADAKTIQKNANVVKEQEDLSVINDVYGPTAAKLWKTLTPGARTEAFKQLNDMKLRGSSPEDIEEMLNAQATRDSLRNTKGVVEKDGSLYPPIKPPQDLRTKDLPNWRENRRKENLPEIKKAQEKINATKKEASYISQLKRIKDTGKLPQGLGRIIINPQTGEPYKVAQLAGKVNAATQLFMKTVNDFTTKAKDSFGARVTNFDLERFMARLPGLLNTPEGIDAILGQMELVNQLDSAYDNELNKVFAHYGAGDITLEQADEIARKNIAPQISSIENQLENLVLGLDEQELEESAISEAEQSEDFPPAVQHEGRIIEDEETGQKYRSDGKNWIKV